MKRWILLAFVGLVGCNSYVDPDWYNKPAFTEHLATIYAYPSVPVTPGKLLAIQGSTLQKAPSGMVWIPIGTFLMGANDKRRMIG